MFLSSYQLGPAKVPMEAGHPQSEWNSIGFRILALLGALKIPTQRPEERKARDRNVRERKGWQHRRKGWRLLLWWQYCCWSPAVCAFPGRKLGVWETRKQEGFRDGNPMQFLAGFPSYRSKSLCLLIAFLSGQLPRSLNDRTQATPSGNALYHSR